MRSNQLALKKEQSQQISAKKEKKNLEQKDKLRLSKKSCREPTQDQRKIRNSIAGLPNAWNR